MNVPRSWKDVLDCKIAGIITIEQFLPIVDQAGYEFFEMSGKIYHMSVLVDFGSRLDFYSDTGMTDKHLD